MARQHRQLETRRACKLYASEFSVFTGLAQTVQLRTVTRAYVITWRKEILLLSWFFPPFTFNVGSLRISWIWYCTAIGMMLMTSPRPSHLGAILANTSRSLGRLRSGRANRVRQHNLH